MNLNLGCKAVTLMDVSSIYPHSSFSIVSSHSPETDLSHSFIAYLFIKLWADVSLILPCRLYLLSVSFAV